MTGIKNLTPVEQIANLNFRSEGFQSRVRRCIMMLEDATRLVSLADVFSRNESVGEVPTEHVKFFLLPALLATANGKLFDGGLDRAEAIAVQEAYIREVQWQNIELTSPFLLRSTG